MLPVLPVLMFGICPGPRNYLIAGQKQVSSPYIDPGSSAFLWQILMASLLAVSFYVRSSINWIKDSLRRRKN